MGGAAAQLGTGAKVGLALAVLVFALACAVAGAVVARKAGYRARAGVLLCVPGVNVVLVLIAATRKWPVHVELDALRAKVAGRGPTLVNRTTPTPGPTQSTVDALEGGSSWSDPVPVPGGALWEGPPVVDGSPFTSPSGPFAGAGGPRGGYVGPVRRPQRWGATG